MGRILSTRVTIISDGRVRVDVVDGEVTVDGVRIDLTGRELRLLVALMRHRHDPVTAERLALLAWGDVYDLESAAHRVQRLIRVLRREIGEDRIRAVRGGGYVFEHANGALID